MNRRSKLVPGIFLALLLASPLSGCSTRREVVVRDEVASPTVVRTEVRETELEDDDDDVGILSSTIGLAGDIIALPFRAVGALIDVIV